MENPKKSITIPLIIGGLVLIITVGAGGLILTLSQQNNAVKNTISNQTSNTIIPNAIVNNSVSNTTSTNMTDTMMSQFKAGTYSAEANYETPESNEVIKVTITLENNGTVSSLEVDTGNPSSFDSEKYQKRFKQGITSMVVGKTLDKVTVGRVNGSSLTPNGFNAAINKIKLQAQV